MLQFRLVGALWPDSIDIYFLDVDAPGEYAADKGDSGVVGLGVEIIGRG